MKKLILSTLLLALPLLASAYDIEVANADRVTIYYNFINDGTELEVTYKGYYSDSYNEYSGIVNIPEEVTYNGNTLKVTTIGNEAFSGCSGLTSVKIPNTVTSIGIGAFAGCSGLTSVTIPNSVTTIGNRAFADCSSLTSVHITDLAAWCKIAFSTFDPHRDSNPLCCAKHLFLNGEEIKDLVIPNSVTSIGENAFYGCSGLTSVTIPNSVTTIGNAAFGGCNSLTSVTIPNSVTTIGMRAFADCSSLTSVHITDLAAWCEIAFSDVASNPLCCAKHLFLNGEEIKDLVIPNSVTSIGENAFYKCSGLTSVTIPNSVTTIGERAFLYCTGMTSVSIGNSVTTIENVAFYGCTGLTSLTIPNSVTTIRGQAFEGCSGLTSVTIPNSVTSIGDYAFRNCSGLTSVISKMENPCFIYNTCFEQDVFNNATLYVLWGTTEKYQSKNYWNKFVLIEELPYSEICATPTISYANKKLTFSCETEGVEYVSEIRIADAKKSYDAEVDLSATYEISVYATKSGYGDSDVAKATLVWTNAQFSEDMGITTLAKTAAESIPVLISAKGGQILVKSEQEGQPVAVYSIDGKALGASRINGGQTIISTNLNNDEIVIVKVGNRSVKMKM